MILVIHFEKDSKILNTISLVTAVHNDSNASFQEDVKYFN